MRWYVAIPNACVLLALTGCYCSHVAEAPLDAGSDATAPPDARLGVDARVRVTGCEDPLLWSAPAEEAGLAAVLGGGPCGPAQLPLHAAVVSGVLSRRVSPGERATFARSCWRVVDAHEGSGWSAGEMIALDAPRAALSLVGFERPVTFEGRVLRDDGTLAFAVRPRSLALDPARVVEPSSDGAVAVMTEDAWAERDTLHLWGESLGAEEVVDGAATLPGAPVTLHHGAAGYTLRFWGRSIEGAVTSTDLFLGQAERARLARGGGAVALDDELVVVGSEGGALAVTHRFPLPEAPLEIVSRYHYVVVHVAGALIVVRRISGESSSLTVGPGALLPTQGDSALSFFDGASFVPVLPSDGALALDEARRVSPRPEHLAALGRPLSVQHGVVLGENGFLLAFTYADVPAAGPRFAPISELFGDGHLTHVGDDGVTYAIERADGTTSLYRAPFVDFCE